jgi:hypothetical protein
LGDGEGSSFEVLSPLVDDGILDGDKEEDHVEEGPVGHDVIEGVVLVGTNASGIDEVDNLEESCNVVDDGEVDGVGGIKLRPDFVDGMEL